MKNVSESAHAPVSAVLRNRRWLLLAAALGLLTLVIYLPVSRHSFINYDDPVYVTQNPHVTNGVEVAEIAWAFTALTGQKTYWHPVTWISHMVDCELFGLNPAGHHVMNLLFHTLNAILLFLLLHCMTGSLWRSVAVAALFAWHPLQVDSVAWVAERKNVLSTFFGLLTLLAYFRYAKKPNFVRYLWIVIPFALGLMSKFALVTLPFVLLLLDYWPLRRWGGSGNKASTSSPSRLFAKLVLEKLPLFAMSAAMSATIWMAHQRKGDLFPGDQFPLPLRLSNAVVSYARYLKKVLWPNDLAVFYPYPAGWPAWQVALAVIILAAITMLAIWRARTRPYFLVGWLWFLGVLFPFIGVVQAGLQAMADRFAYIPVIGLFVAGIWGLSDWAAVNSKRRTSAIAIAAAVMALCLVSLPFHLRHWKNSESLFRHALKVTDNNYIAHHNLADALLMQQKTDEATKHYLESLKIKPDHLDAHYNLGTVYLSAGKLNEAIPHLERALELRPDLTQARNNLAVSLARLGRLPEATVQFSKLLEDNPANAEVHYNMAVALKDQGRLSEATRHFFFATQFNPQYAQAHFDLAMTLFRLQQPHQAVPHLQAAVNINPNWVNALNNLAWVLATHPDPRLRNGREAVALAERASKLVNPTPHALLDTLSAAYAEAGRFDEAVAAATDARNRALAENQAGPASAYSARLEKYKQRQPWREP